MRCEEATAQNGTRLIALWSSGTTEQGSSGSPLFSTSKGSPYVVGQLHSGGGVCEATRVGLYGRFDLAFHDGLKTWLAPSDSPAPALSGGERRRVALASLLVQEWDLLVLDEPTANLDPQGIDDVYAALTEVVAAGDRAILLVEHNLDAAARITDRVVVLVDGRVAAVGPWSRLSGRFGALAG